MFSRSTALLRSSLRTASPLTNRTFASTTLLRNSTANASQSTHDAEQARDQGEQKIYDKLKTKFTPKTLDVMDVSGKCGLRSLGDQASSISLTNGLLAIGSFFVLRFTRTGGCGSFYAIHISSPLFKGLTTIKQHRLVNECLKEEVKDIHGLQVSTVRWNYATSYPHDADFRNPWNYPAQDCARRVMKLWLRIRDDDMESFFHR